MDARLAAMRTPHGEQRFWPPGTHPAFARMREQLRRAEELRDRWNVVIRLCGRRPPVIDDLDEFIEDLQLTIAEFEERESERRAEALERLECA